MLFLLFLASCNTPFFFSEDAFITQFEKSDGKKGTTYTEMVEYYKNLASRYSEISLRTIQNDGGEPLYVVIYNPESTFDFNRIQKDKTILLISNGMYQGQTEGIDATMLLMRNLAESQIRTPENLVVMAIPAMNKEFQKDSLTSKYVNTLLQRHDLDEDFIKNDTRNTLVFSEIFHSIQPHIFVDTRSLPQYNNRSTIFYQSVVSEKMGDMKLYFQKNFLPRLTDSLVAKKGMQTDSIPTHHQLFLPYPHEVLASCSASSSIGYTSLWNTLSLKIASQIDKPYKERVEGMYNALKMIVSVCDTDAVTIKRLQKEQTEKQFNQKYYALAYEPNLPSEQEIFIDDFVEDSTFTDTTKIYNLQKKKITYFTDFKATDSIVIPEKYIVPKGLRRVIERLHANRIQLKSVENDTILMATTYRISDISTSVRPIDGRYKHTSCQVTSQQEKVFVQKGDFWVETNQNGLAYLLEVLEPRASESFFNWNFFDIILSTEDETTVYPIFRIEKSTSL